MIYFSSDIHYSHDKPFIWQARGFNNIDEHNAAIIERHNSKVTDNDEVYYLGDLYLGDNKLIPQFLEQLNGKKHLIRGNHDTNERLKVYEPYFEWIKDYYELKYHKKRFILSHYAFEVWNGCQHEAKMLHGHSHGSLETKLPNRMDVGVDTNNCYPYSIEEIINILKNNKQIIYDNYGIDHHTLQIIKENK